VNINSRAFELMRKSAGGIRVDISIILLLVLSTSISPASNNPGGSATSSSSSTQETYEIEVLAVDETLRPVTDLKPEDFQLTLNKADAKIEFSVFAPSEPLNFLMLFDFSRSRARDRDFKKELTPASDFLRKVWRPADSASIVAFSDLPRTLVASAKSLDSVTQAIEYLSRLNPNGSTSLYDAICSTSDDHHLALSGRNIFLVLSDFHDDSSRHTAEQGLDCVMDGVGRNAIYSVDYKGNESDDRAT
jgi:Mg-chelatase subunit ChlD